MCGAGYLQEQENLLLYICKVNKLQQYCDIPGNINMVCKDHQDKYLPTIQ